MPDDRADSRRRRHPGSERLVRTLTFWLRPDFVLRVINRFQKVTGFDRAIALASSSLTAVIPLAVLSSPILSQFGGKGTAERVIDRYELTGGGAAAVRALFSPASGTSTSVSIVALLFLTLAVLSFARAMQRLFEQAWELKPLSVRNTPNGLRWIAGLALYLGLGSLAYALVDRGALDLAPTLLLAPVTAVFLLWSGWVLSAKRIPRPDLVPFAILGAVSMVIFSVGARVYLPHLFSSYATRYGVVGAVLAMISALFCGMVLLVGSAATGREVDDELDRIRRGDRPADDEVRRQWHAITAEMRSRWATLGRQVTRRRRSHKEP